MVGESESHAASSREPSSAWSLLEAAPDAMLVVAASGQICIEIGDTGSGMAPEVQRRAFDPFFTTKLAGLGTGLGLAICMRIVNGLGGSIDVESQPGKGSLFRVRLPASAGGPQAPGASKSEPGLGAAPVRRGRALVVDDEELLGSAIRRGLEPAHEVVVVKRAREALERLAAGERFDVILCDLMMPELSGVEFHRQLGERAPLASSWSVGRMPAWRSHSMWRPRKPW